MRRTPPPTDFTAVCLGETSSCNSDGSFSAKVYTNGVTVVGAIHKNGKMGLMNVVATSNGSVRSVSSSRALSSDPIELDANTTAVSMVFTSPLLLTSDPTKASSLLDIIENDPEVEILANVIESVFNEPDPLENTTLQEALGDALRSVLDTIISETSSSVGSATLQPVSSPRFIHLPKRSNEFSNSSAKALAATPYSVDLDYVKVNISQTSGVYKIDLDSRQLNAVDWLGELGRLDSSDFTSLEDLKDKATDRFNIYSRQYTYPIKDRAPAKGITRWLNFIDTMIDSAFDYFLRSGGIEIPSTENDIHILRAYSGGGWKADSSERAFISQVPGGTSADRYALAFNILSAVLDAVSILIPLDILYNDECQATLLVNVVDDVVDDLYENANLVGSVEDFHTIAAPVLVETISGFGKCLAGYAVDNFLKFVAKAAKKSATEAAKWISFYKWVEIAGKTGQIIERGVRLGLYATPLESAFIVVGSPFCDEFDTDCDGYLDEIDNCPNTYNPDQLDSDNDGIGDVCEVLTDTDIGCFSSHFASGHYVQLYALDPTHDADSITVTGPGLDTPFSLTFEAYRPGEWWSVPNVFLGMVPVYSPPLTYSFDVESNGEDYTLDCVVDSLVDEFATDLSPSGGEIVSVDFTFSWTGIGLAGTTYQIQLDDTSGQRIWNSEITTENSIPYTGLTLSSGSTYRYYVVAIDTYGNQSLAQEWFVYE